MPETPTLELTSPRTAPARRRRRLSLDSALPWLLVVPAVLILLVFTIYPIIYNLDLSLRNVTLYNYRAAQQTFVGLGKYLQVLSDQEFWSAVGATFTYTIASVGIGLVIAFALALLFERYEGIRARISPFLLVPLMATPAVIALAWNQLLIADIGVVNYLLRLIGLNPPPWLGTFPWPLISVITIDIWQHVPFMFFVLLAGLTVLPEEPFEAAAIDGASAWQTFRHLTLPLLSPVILVTVIFRGMTAFTSFDVIYILTGGAPGSGTETLNLFLYRKAFKAWNFSEAGAIAVLMVILTGAIAITLISLLNREESL
ncbi:MAG: sugar ABC transporter permease [Chloroflexi bacterium]|nr:sugar ABC transporter permease [Chloroflexota bacterium]MCL5109839.1 sugar ABC transporter permease [Chloroflexota bacterium]